MISNETPVGTVVVMTQTVSEWGVNGGQVTFIPGEGTFTITRMGTHKAVVRRTGDGVFETSMWVYLVHLDLADPNAPQPRRLGEAPEGMIATDDPRLAWFWEDAAKYAKQQGYCNVYDQICARLGVPGRKRTFSLNRTLAPGITISASIEAHTHREAEEELDRRLAEVQTPTPQTA